MANCGKGHRKMKTRTLWMFGWLAPALLVACATNSHKTTDAAGKVTPQMRSGSNEMRAYQLLEWIAPDDRTLLVNGVDRSLYRASFKGQCTGLRLVDTIAFIVQTPPQVDKYEGVVLPNGTRCAFTSITRLEVGPVPAGPGKSTPATENP
jgi:Family of unknown function (DUF6491)